jgi:hypothetical protein
MSSRNNYDEPNHFRTMSSRTSMMKGSPRKGLNTIKDKEDPIWDSIDERKADGSILNVIRQNAKFK